MIIQASRRVLMNFLTGILFLCGCQHANSAVWQMPPEAFGQIDNSSLSAADDNGHVMLLVKPVSVSNDLNAYYYTGGNWVLSEVLTTDATDNFDVAMDPTGTALAIYQDVNTQELFSRYFNGSVWGPPSLPLDNISVISMSVEMNGPASGVAVWNDVFGVLKSSFYSGGTWSPFQIIATGVFTFVDVFYSPNGTAIASYDDFVVNYNGVAWQAPQQFLNLFEVGDIDNSGVALISQVDGAGNIIITRFNAATSTFTPGQIISTGTFNSFPLVKVAPGGTAVAVWTNGAGGNDLEYSTYNGFSWSAPMLVSIASSNYDLALDTAGNALLVYVTSDNEIFAIRLPLGGAAWGPPELVSPEVTGFIVNLTAALSLNGVGFASWTPVVGEFEFSLFANASILDIVVPPTPPLAISGFSCRNQFASQTDIVNQISFVPSTDTTVFAYYVRRDGILIAAIPSVGPFTYIEHNLCKNQTYVYSVTAVDVFGVESLPVVIALP